MATRLRLEGELHRAIDKGQLVVVHQPGFQIGTGRSSLSHRSRLPMDTLKVDRSFVAELERGSDEAIVVGAIIRLGDSLHKHVVAEGIESASQMAQLREPGCTRRPRYTGSLELFLTSSMTA